MLPKISFTIERWRYNKTFEVYVSNQGRVRNSSKALLAPRINKCGYCLVRVGGSIYKYMYVHRLVMLTWRPTPEAESLTVDHLDHNKRNNAVSNLEWVSYEENQRRAKEDFLTCEESGAVDTYEVVIYDGEKIKWVTSSTDDLGEDFWKKIGYGTSKRNCMAQEKVIQIIDKLLIGEYPDSGKKYCGLTFKRERKVI